MTNPFEILEQRLTNIEAGILEIKNRPQPETDPPREKYLTVDQVAEMLSVSRVTLWSWDKKEILNPVRIGNLKRYRLSEIESLGGTSGENQHQKKVS
jgi:predicted DNA-binding transcriptional regulator AlpA